MLSSALSEAEVMGVRQELDAMLAAVDVESSKDDLTYLERFVKTTHDRFADAGAAACARFVLAVSMDLRKGMGRELGPALSSLNKRG
jgi:hypothetical protein